MSNYIDRPPRIQPEIPIQNVEIPAPPRSDQAQRQPLWQTFVPMVTIIGYVLVSATGQGSNITFLIPMGLAMFISVGVAVANLLRTRRLEREKREAYIQRLVTLRREMTAQHDKQRRFYLYNYPDPATILQIDGRSQDTRSGSRLWERRTYDLDFGVIRLGIGVRPSTFTYTVSQSENDENPLRREAERLAADSRLLTDAPITMPLYRHQSESDAEKHTQNPLTPPLNHPAVGVAGDASQVYPFIQSLVTQYVALHSPIDAQLYVLGLHEAETYWEWAKVLPHVPIPRSSKPQTFEQAIMFEGPNGRFTEDEKEKDKEHDEVALYLKNNIYGELDRRARRLREKDDKDTTNVTLPFMLLIIDMLAAKPGQQDDPLSRSALSDIESEAAISMLLQSGSDLGVTVIFLVPKAQKIISGCTAVIELTGRPGEPPNFLYAEVGVNTPRFVGIADTLPQYPTGSANHQLKNFANALQSARVRRSFGSEVPTHVGLLELFDAATITDLEIDKHWKSSKNSEQANWLEVAVGMISGKEKRRLKFSADADGVHGMIAGSTGSGKSELLMTMILGLALRYDPSIVNFVLVDYKGGAAFDPFDNLPHKVDKVTNLGPGAVARMFAAINAELNRRQKINSDNDVKHIVEYRKKGLHLRPGGEYPHLLIVIDEFAEMIANNQEYRAQLESITRLGRSLGVTLILAAQRPSGVSDQMRANIKFRICLRVETREESNELLRRPDAAYLPNGVPGRGYLQVGNDNLQQIQAAYTGSDYSEPDAESDADPINRDLDRFRRSPVIWLDDLDKMDTPKLFEVLVSRMNRIAMAQSTRQRKPWPSPLPRYMALNDPGEIAAEVMFNESKVDYNLPDEFTYLLSEDLEHLEAGRDAVDPGRTTPLTLSPYVTAWLGRNVTRWGQTEKGATLPPGGGIDWSSNRPARAMIGLIDDPGNAQLRGLKINLTRGHAIIFGASGWGKTTFLRSLLAELAATHSPRDLHVYLLDFSNRNLELFRNLPHVGAHINNQEAERVTRLIRFLEQENERRKDILSSERTNSLYSYNEQNPENAIPVLLILIDNIAELRENFEGLLAPLTALLREGLTTGIHVVATADQMGAVGKLYGLFPERYALKMAEPADVPAIVGRGARFVEETPGRGFCVVGRVPLEFQVAVPVGVNRSDRDSGTDETKKLDVFIQILRDAWEEQKAELLEQMSTEAQAELKYLLPRPISPLPQIVLFEPPALHEIGLSVHKVLNVGLGIDDTDLELRTRKLDFRLQPHFVITGASVSGKTTALQTFILWLATRFTSAEVGLILVDRQERLAEYGGNLKLDQPYLPHLLMPAISEPEDFKEMVERLKTEYHGNQRRDIFVIIDNYDDIEEMAPRNSNLLKELGNLGRRKGSYGLHIVVAGTQNSLRQPDDLTRATIYQSRYGLGMDADHVSQAPLGGKLLPGMNQIVLPPGRAFLAQRGRVVLMQIASPYTDDTRKAQEMDALVGFVMERSYPPAQWSSPNQSHDDQDTEDTRLSRSNGASASTGTSNGQDADKPAITPEQMRHLRQRVADQMLGGRMEMLTHVADSGILEMAERYGISSDEA